MKVFFTQKSAWLIFFLLLVASGISYGQGYNTTNWKFSNPKQFGFLVQDIDFYDNNNVIAVGADGGIAKSADGGLNWTYGPFTFLSSAGLLTKTTLTDVHYITASVAYAVGGAGCMAKTTDGGTTWNFVTTPLFANAKNINTCWFLNKDTGYIAGQFNTLDSMPKIYFTRNGGSTWDSIAAPASNGKSRVGYINNPNIPSVLFNVDAKSKEIFHIEFINDSTGYACGSASSLFPAVPGGAANATTCLPTGGSLTTSAQNAALLWKISKNVPTDFSLSKERLGYTGINTNTVNCTSSYNSATVTPTGQTYKAMSVINDSTVVVMSFNNNIVVRVNTGKNDSTANVNIAGTYEKGKYQILNFPFPPTQGPNAGSPIPPVQVLFVSNPLAIKKSVSGKLYATSGSSTLNPVNHMWTSVDTGRNWVEERNLPTGRNYSQFNNFALDISPSGKFIAAGQQGVVGLSDDGINWTSNYVTTPTAASYMKTDFADCNNGMFAGGSNITVTTDGGKTYIDNQRPDFASSFYNINGIAYPDVSKAYLAVSNGIIYTSTDKGTTLDPSYSDFNFQMQDVSAISKDTAWGIGYSSTSLPFATRTSKAFRTYNGGSSWTPVGDFPVGGASAAAVITMNKIAFTNATVGYASGNRNSVYKTIDAGATWTRISPFPSLNEGPAGFPNSFIQYQELVALDNNTVFVIGNMFTSTGVKRVYKTTDGGTTWTDITGNMNTLFPNANIIGLAVHDVNNIYVTAGSALFTTTNGGTSWTMEYAPTNSLFENMAFAPRKVPASIPFANRRLFVSGISAPTANASIMEYGNPLNTAVNSTETVVNATCTNLSGGSITINASGAIAPYQYSINGGAFQSSNVFTGLTQGVKSITIKDAYCGTLTKNVTVGFTNNLTLTTTPATDTTVCAGAPVPLLATSAATTYAWSPAAGLSNTAINNPIAIVNSNSTYTVTATLGTCVKTGTVNIFIKANPLVNAGPDKTMVIGQGVTLDGSGSNSYKSLAWTPAASLTGANSYTPLANPSLSTVYTLTIVDNNNCTSTDNVTVTVIPYCVKAMNAFTPNGDGMNDKWLVTNGGCTNQIIAKVYNRNGSLIYSSDNYHNDWDGTYKGKPVADGTYYYTLTYRLIDGREIPLKGDVTILR